MKHHEFPNTAERCVHCGIFAKSGEAMDRTCSKTLSLNEEKASVVADDLTKEFRSVFNKDPTPEEGFLLGCIAALAVYLKDNT